MKYVLLAALGLSAGMSAQEIRLTQVTSGVSSPTDIQSARDGSGRLFLVQQDGIVRIFRNGALLNQPFLDIRNKTRAGGERGLLGLAFPPRFPVAQRFYVNYTDLQGDTVIAMYRVSSSPDVADAASETVLLRIDQPFSNHNGGQLVFGPDGYLYIGMGDGGSGGDPQGHGQNRNSLLGKMLRIDVETEPGSVRVPSDNPFAAVSNARPEIWSYGLRNPWRFSFDRATNDLWIADVGQGAWEEVNFQPASSRGGENYGWNIMEGAHCYGSATCNTQSLIQPVAEYSHSFGCSVTGGFVYRGRSYPGMRGIYLYADYCSGRIWGVERQGNQWANRVLLDSNLGISTFGEDEAGELYLGAANGTIHLVEGSTAPRIAAGAIVNSASFLEGLSPGSLATVFAAGVRDDPGITESPAIPLEKALNGVSVTVNGVPAPIHAVANQNGQEQINFQAPFESLGRASSAVVVTRDGRSSAPVEVPVVQIQPAVYTDAAGNAVVVHNADYTLVTPASPLVPGEYAFLYAAGLGRVANQPESGAAAPLLPLASTLGTVRVTLAGIASDVQYAGLAPGLVGVFQVNFRVPAGAPSGSQDVVVSVDGAPGPRVRVQVR